MRGRATQYALWGLLALPAFYLVWAWVSDRWSYGESVSESGLWSVWLLMITLCATPLRRSFGMTTVTRFLVKRRRDLGVATLLYAALHMFIYLVQKENFARIIDEAGNLWLAVGWLAFAICTALAVTSNDRAVRMLSENWKRLHRLVYPAAVLVFMHWILSAFDPTAAWIHLMILMVLLSLRFVPKPMVRTIPFHGETK